MLSNILKIFLYFLKILDIFFKFFKRKSFFQNLNDHIAKELYTETSIENKKIKFFVPSKLTLERVSTIFTKEPETINWIKDFKLNNNLKEIIFWDIGANIGVYSIYASIFHKRIKVFSFEASTSNLRCLSRNISINRLNNKIKICQIPLTNKKNVFLEMKEKNFTEGSAISTFGEDFDFKGEKILDSKNNYSLFGTNINTLLEDKVLEIPNYIKIDVDGIEHLILEGASKFLSNKDLRGISVELNENFSTQYQESIHLLKNCGFLLTSNEEILKKKNEKKINTRNYHFKKI